MRWTPSKAAADAELEVAEAEGGGVEVVGEGAVAEAPFAAAEG